MINEKVVVTAKIWRELESIRSSIGMRESEFEQLALLVFGLACVVRLPTSFASEFVARTRVAFEILKTTHDRSRFDKFWVDSCDLLAGLVAGTNRSSLPHGIGSIEAFQSIAVVLDRLEERSVGSEIVLDAFDEVFHRVVARQTATRYRSGDMAAFLAAHLSDGVERVAEYFATTGELAVYRKRSLGFHTSARMGIAEDLRFFVGLRLVIHGIEFESAPSRGDDFSFFTSRGFFLIDHPSRATSTARPYAGNWMEHRSSLEALDYLIQNHLDPEVGLAVVPGADRSIGGWRMNLREMLLHSGRLIAVIDLPIERSERSRRSISAWVFVAQGGRFGDKVLMLNAKSLAAERELSEAGALMAVVAAIVARGAFHRLPSPILRLPSFQLDGINAILEGHFSNGYRDVDGLCRLVHIDEIARSDFNLTASLYVKGLKRTKTDLKLLNGAPVLEALQLGRERSVRIYVIGNNGEGKSILLRDLADELEQQDRRVVGISFGLTDRFPFIRPKTDKQPFVYIGARTSEHSIALTRTFAEVDRMVRSIHVDQRRLNVFNTMVTRLGFGQRRYLVPRDLRTSLEGDRAQFADLQQLSENAAENALFFRETPAKYGLGLMRRDSESLITTFSELSSGEQQVLTLALKLAAFGDEGIVFLIDEPELSLHVSWQRALPSILEIVGSQFGCSVVVATHSPVIVTSANHLNDRCFVARRRVLTELNSRQLRSVESALFEGFHTYTANNRQVHERCAAMVSQAIQGLNSEHFGLDEVSSLSYLTKELDDMESTIRDARQTSIEHDDLDLVSRTRAAFAEIVALKNGKV